MRLPSLDHLLAEVSIEAQGLAQPVRGVTHDSRLVEPGFLFVALPGGKRHGAQFAPQAVERGALAVVSNVALDLPVPSFQVKDARAALADLACAFYNHPSRHLTVVGVTGTDGKSTTCAMIEHILRASGLKTGLHSTVLQRTGEELHRNPTGFTTPEAPEVQSWLAQLYQQGATHVVLETSSHALAQQRVRGVRYQAAAFTNLTPEHLDFHRTLDEYRSAKRQLLEVTSASGGSAALNGDDPSYSYMAQAIPAHLRFGLGTTCQVRASELQLFPTGSRFTLHTPAGTRELTLALPAQFNAYNALGATALALLLGIDLDVICGALERFAGVPGRMETITGPGFTVVVDFAHTPDALAKVLQALRPSCRGRLIVVFGMAGERDSNNRPLAGRAIARSADRAVFTEDDSRSERREDIMAAIASGAQQAGWREGREYTLIPDRRSAIAQAFQAAQPGDMVLLAGKGHEQTLIRTEGKIPWDDRSVALELLRSQ